MKSCRCMAARFRCVPARRCHTPRLGAYTLNVTHTEPAITSDVSSRDPGGTLQAALRRKIKQRRVLVFSARGLVSQFRHLMLNMRLLLPHHKKEVKVRRCRNQLPALACGGCGGQCTSC